MEFRTDQILALTTEAAVLTRGNRVIYANARAIELLGPGCVDKSVQQLFGEDVAGSQAHSFLADVSINGRSHLLRVTDGADGRIIFLAPQDDRPAILNEPFLCSMRAALMNIGMAARQLRDQAEDRQDKNALRELSALTASFYRILRMSSNATVALAVSQGGLRYTPGRVNLSELCRSVVDGVAFFFPKVSFQLDDGGGQIIAAVDAELIRQMLLNLLSNALIHAGGSCVRVRLTQSETSVLLSVSDDGAGIPPERLPTVFDRYRHGFDLSQMGSGPGLGLAVCRAVAARHGGALLLESRVGCGTEVRVSLSRERTGRLGAPEGEAQCTVKEILTGMADCLPVESFSPRYLD